MQIVRIGAGSGAMSVAQAHYLMKMIRQCDPEVIPELIQYDQPSPGQTDAGPVYREALEQALLEERIDFGVMSLDEIPCYSHDGLEIIAVSKRFDASCVLIIPPGETRYNTALPLACTSLLRRHQLAAMNPTWNIQVVDGPLETLISRLDARQFGAVAVGAWQMQIQGIRRHWVKQYHIHEVTPAVGEGVVALLGRKKQPAGCLKAFHSAASWDMMTAESAFLQVFDPPEREMVAAHAMVREEKPLELGMRGMWIDPEMRIWRGQFKGRREHALMIGAALAQTIRLDRADALKAGQAAR